ncbi:MAG: bifunctional folylpolyglutamate synthase/dihydrofolate synthase [Bacteroidaceae bacterium]|nr:bifunctional folylpolyglutamate synthase/dihydrofolate synthase [Bacteroidaceae bacterium]
MTYKDTIQYLYDSTPLFQHIGAGAYKEGLTTTHKLDDHFGHPHRLYKTIHVAGTNGKGSCSHTLAAIFQSAGYRVGLYTSPHLLDFRERIRINGEMIPEQYVIDFVEKERSFFEPLHPSFFELATAMAFKYFADENVDIAIVEVGLGGRLDCTNIIQPELSIITNISFDHTQFLGDTLAKIAYEKAGIMKKGVPVIIGEVTSETREVFEQQSKEVECPIIFAEDYPIILNAIPNPTENFGLNYTLRQGFLNTTTLYGELGGEYQAKNTNTLLHAIRQLIYNGIRLNDEHIRQGFAQVTSLTGLLGRWQKIKDKPLVLCDTGHNTGGIKYVSKQLQSLDKPLHIVIGMVNDKDINGVLDLLPRYASYYFTQASVKRALPADQLREMGKNHNLTGNAYPNVAEAFDSALKNAKEDDVVFVGGSNFIVADFLLHISENGL